MDAARAKKWMQLFNEKIQDQKDYLSDLDTPIGDGDHGAAGARREHRESHHSTCGNRHGERLG